MISRVREYGRSSTIWFQRAKSVAAIIVADVAGRVTRRESRPPSGTPRIFPIYFSYRGDSEYLGVSIRSLVDRASSHIGAIHVYEDRAQPLTADQRQTLSEISSHPVVFRRTRAPMTWGGVTLLHNELSAFVDVTADLGANDYIVKVDSDVLFTAEWLFPAALSSRADLVGQPVSSIPTHTQRAVADVQGGCYFLRVGALRQLRAKSLLSAARRVARDTNYGLWRVPEDRTVSQWAHDAGLNMKLVDFYLLDLARLRTSPFETDSEIEHCLEQRSPFAVIHFERCKERMVLCYRWLRSE